MGFNKKNWLFLLLALGELIAIVILAPANCGHDTVDKEPSNVERQKMIEKTDRLPKDSGVGQPICADDYDCPPSSSCLDGICVTNHMDDDEVDNGDRWDTAQSCANAKDCGYGYDCVDNQCHKLDPSCYTNADCGTCLVCVKKESWQNGTCMLSECDTDAQCGGRCGTHCDNHRCKELNCCADADCPTGQFCELYGDATEGNCKTPQCFSNADCGCGTHCYNHFCRWGWSANRYSCCGTDFYHEGFCVPQTNIENGRCLEDAHCPAGKVCVEDGICLPATCTDNASCGCEAVCRKGHCETGCDENNDCCDDGDICDRGLCVDSNEEDEEDYD